MLLNSTIPIGLCQCGCGQKTNLARQTDRAKGWVKGQPLKFLLGHVPWRKINAGLPTGACKPTSVAERLWSRVDKGHGCWLWRGYVTAAGYGQMGAGLTHRVSYELTYGPIPTGLEICHSCDTPNCVRPDHLFIGTHAENMADMAIKNRSNYGRHPESIKRGEQVGTSILTSAQVIEIRLQHKAGMTQAQLARQYRVTASCIYDVIKRKNWAHI